MTLATVSVLANTLVIAVHALDGSAESDRLEALGGAVHRPLRDERQRHERATAWNTGSPRWAASPTATWPWGSPRPGTNGLRPTASSTPGVPSIRARPLRAAVDPNERDGVIGYRHTEATPVSDERALRLAQRHVHAPLDSAQPAVSPPPGDLDNGNQAAA